MSSDLVIKRHLKKRGKTKFVDSQYHYGHVRHSSWTLYTLRECATSLALFSRVYALNVASLPVFLVLKCQSGKTLKSCKMEQLGCILHYLRNWFCSPETWAGIIWRTQGDLSNVSNETSRSGREKTTSRHLQVDLIWSPSVAHVGQMLHSGQTDDCVQLVGPWSVLS